jgi:APA family basic amino acid/polyamine antiporter
MQTKPLHFRDLIMLVISLMIGLGIFSTPSSVATQSGSETLFFTVWVVGGLLALLGALVYAQLGVLVPESGAYYKVVAKAYHPAIGFSINVLIFCCNAASLAIVTLIGAEYAAQLLQLPSDTGYFPVLFGLSCLTLFLFVNLRGLRTSSLLLTFLLVLKLVLMLVLISTLFYSTEGQSGNLASPTLHSISSQKPIWQLFVVSLIPVCFTYGGYQQTINFGASFSSTHYIRKGIVWGVVTVTLLYLLLNLAYVHVLGFESLQTGRAIGSSLFRIWFGSYGERVFDALMVFSVMAYTNVLLMSNPLVMHAMAKDRLLPRQFQQVHPRTGANTTGLITFYVLTVLILFIGKRMDEIMGFTMFLDSMGMVVSAGSIFILRKKVAQPHTPRWILFLAAIFIFFYILVALGVFIQDARAACIAIGLFGTVWVVGYWQHHARKSQKGLPNKTNN